MYKKLLLGSVLVLSIICSFTLCFANNGLQDLADGAKNIVGGAENAIEDGVKDISNKSKEMTGSMENGANEVGNTVTSSMTDGRDGIDTGYTATRTATDTNTFMGMNATAWTWLIIGIVTIAIVALVWYYSMQFNHNKHHE